MKSRRLAAFAALVLLIAAAVVSTEVYLYSGNTLYENGRWKASKNDLELGVMGAATCMVTRTALAGNHLNLGAWNGFQELLAHQPLPLIELSGSVWMPPNGYVYLEFNRDDEGFLAFRLSRNPEFPNALLSVARDGGFRSRRVFPPLRILEGWNRFRITFDQHRASLFLNETWVVDADEPMAPLQRVGFRGGLASVYIDDVDLVSSAAPRRIHESFRNSHRYPWIFCSVFIVLAALVGIRALLGYDPTDSALLVGLAVLAGSGTMLALDFYWLSPRYPLFPKRLVAAAERAGYQNRIETQARASERLRGKTCNRDRTCILFLGSSQTWGAGAEKAEDTFVARVESHLNQGAGKAAYESINAAVPGFTSDDVLKAYLDGGLDMKPQITVINLGNNDRIAEDLRRNLGQILATNRERGIRSICVLEANTIEESSDRHQATIKPATLHANHQVIKSTCGEMGVPVVDLDGYLADRHDTGILFWDFVHFTSYGHRLAAVTIADAIAALEQSGAR